MFKQITEQVKKGLHKNDQGFLDIINQAYDMNLQGKRRKLTKFEYIQKYLQGKQDEID